MVSLGVRTVGLTFFSLVLSAKLPLLFQIQKFIIIEYVENCDGKVYPFQLVDLKTHRNGSEIIFSGKVIVSRDIKDPISYQVQIEKCTDKWNPDTCERYNSWRFEKVCSMLKVMPFTTLSLDSHIPPLPCPFKKNNYLIKNARMDTSALSQFLADGNAGRTLWKLRSQFLEANETVGCIDGAFRVAARRH